MHFKSTTSWEQVVAMSATRSTGHGVKIMATTCLP